MEILVGRYQDSVYPVPAPSLIKIRRILQVALPTLRWMHYILRRLDIRADMGHGEALVLFTRTLRALPEILLNRIKHQFLSAVKADVLPRTYLLAGFRFLGQFYHRIQLWVRTLYITFVSFKIRGKIENKG